MKPASNDRPATSGSAALARGAQLFALTNLALTGPLFDLLARQPTFFVAHRLGRTDAIVVALALAFGLPMVLLGVERLVGARFRGPLHAGLVALLAAALGSRIAVSRSYGDLAIVLALASAAIALLLLRRRGGQMFLSLLAVVSLVIPVRFMLSDGVATLGSMPPLASTPTLSEPATVVMIVFDELPLVSLLRPNGRINGERFPGFAGLAARSTWYPNATTVAQFTNQAVPAMLTGRYPREHRQPTVVDHPRNLFTLLSSTMPVHAVEIATALCPTRICPPRGGLGRLLDGTLSLDLGVVAGHLTLPRLLAKRLPTVDQAWAGFANAGKRHGHRSEALVAQVDAFLDQVRSHAVGPALKRPARFYFLHLLLPHTPWRFLPDGTLYPHVAPLGQGETRVWTDDPWLVQQARQRHLFQLAFVDQLLDRILVGLRQTRTYHRSLIAVVADHGLAFRPGSHPRKTTATTAAEILPVPLFVKYPKQVQGRVDDRAAETIDLAPTVLDQLGATRTEWATDGTSLLDDSPPQRHETEVYLRPTDDPAVPRTLRVDRTQLRAETVAAARRLRRLHGTTLDELNQLVPAPALAPFLDRPVEELPFVNTRVEVFVEMPRSVVTVAPDDNVLPLFVRGYLTGGTANRQLPVAIVVDGIVRAFTRTAPSEAESRRLFQALLPASSMPPGEHHIEAVALRPRW